MKKLLLIAAISMVLFGCQKEHTKYRLAPKFKVGDLLQFTLDHERDHYSSDSLYLDPQSGQYIAHSVCCLVNVPQPFKVVGYYYNETWRDNWYYVIEPDGKPWGSAIDELSLQKWNGKLQK